MSMPKIPDINPVIGIVRDDAVNIIITSIAMEELAIAHILNAEGEKLQYVLGTLDGKDPGEITICDIMEVNKSIQKTLKDVIKTEMLLQLKLENAVELSESAGECQFTVRGQKIWRDSNNITKKRPPYVEVTLLRDDKVYRTATVDSTGDGTYIFPCLPVWRDSRNKYIYKIDEVTTPAGYIKTIDGFNIINTIEPGQTTIECSKIWVEKTPGQGRPATITVNLMQNGVQIRSMPVNSPTAPEDTIEFSFDSVPVFDSEGKQYVYSIDEDKVDNYTKTIDGFDITNTQITTP